MTGFNAVFLVVIVVLAVSTVVAFAWAAFIGAGRERSGGPAHGSTERDDDEEPV